MQTAESGDRTDRTADAQCNDRFNEHNHHWQFGIAMASVGKAAYKELLPSYEYEAVVAECQEVSRRSRLGCDQASCSGCSLVLYYGPITAITPVSVILVLRYTVPVPGTSNL